MEYLKENEIEKIIMNYITKEKSNYAILLDGAWGCGKTFFVKNKIIPKIDETTKKSIYVSLYGLSDIKDIDKQIYFGILEKLAPNNKEISIIKKGGNIVITGYKIINEAIGGKLPMVSSDNITSIISLFKNIEDYVLIFDDLERCNVPPNIVLGYINKFVEHKNCKCIIVANQKEISKVSILDNIEIKYLVALDKRIDFKDKKEDTLVKALCTKVKTQEENKIEVSDLKNRIEKIFNENIQYNQIKEKLIGNTIYYRPEIENVLRNIVSTDVKETNIKEFILKYSKELIQLLENERHINIRTLRIAINKFVQVICIVNDIGIDNNELLEEILYNVLIYTLYSTIKNKTGQKEYMWEEFSEYGNIYIGKKKIVAFKFIDRLVNKGALNKENVEFVISEYLENLKMEGSNLNDPLNKLLGYWELEDEVILNNINDLIKKLEKNEYQLQQYPQITVLVMRIKNIGFDKEYLEKIIELMKSNIKVTDIKQSRFDEFGVMLNSEDESIEYNSIMKPIRKLLEIQSGKNREEKINDIFLTGTGWGARFCDYCDNEKNRALTDRKFAEILDIETILKLIDESKVEDISNFRRQLNSIYRFSNINEYYKGDIENLSKLKEGLQNLNSESYGKSKIANIKWLIENIESILERLNK